jgi:uncharacterized protein YoxC
MVLRLLSVAVDILLCVVYDQSKSVLKTLDEVFLTKEAIEFELGLLGKLTELLLHFLLGAP